ncbi:MAG: PAS domain S-box protein [Desulfobacterales bacterium]|nr:MAG: PAS domain S-box protein [Desulfobacterales bacterium]
MKTDVSPQELQGQLHALESEFQAYKTQNEAWKEAKKRFYSLSNRTQDGIYNFNLSIKKYVYTNPSFIKMFGHPCKDIVTTDSAMERILPGDREKLKKRIEASLLDQNEGDEMEYRCVAHDGTIRWMHDRWVVLRDDHNLPTAIEGIVRDITEMKTVISMKDYLESLLESCMDAIIVTNQKGSITLANQGAEALFRLKRNDLVGSFIGDIMQNEFSEGQDIYQLILEHAPTPNYELQALLRDGSVIPLLVSSAFLKDEKNQVIGTISYMRDISIRKQAEERIRMLSQQVIRAREVEMSSIARDLHDHLAQNLYSFNIQLATFLNRLSLPQAACATQAKELLSSLHHIIGDVRKIVFNIHPTSLDTLGLISTVHNLCRNLSQIYGLGIDFKSAGMDALDLNFDVNIAIYRLVQEGLNNIVKHADAQTAEVRLVYSYPKIILRIDDDGKGFDVENLMETASKEGCMGLWSMRERVALLNGEMTIDSRQAMGTRIVIEIPYF